MLRLMNKADIPQLAIIENLAQTAPWSTDVFERCWEVGYAGWVLEQSTDIIGFILASFQMGECHILNFCVHPDYQHQGFGKTLLEHVLRAAKNQQLSMAILEVRRSNIKAISLYEKAGFVQIAERKGYYPGPKDREDALIFAIDLTVQ